MPILTILYIPHDNIIEVNKNILVSFSFHRDKYESVIISFEIPSKLIPNKFPFNSNAIHLYHYLLVSTQEKENDSSFMYQNLSIQSITLIEYIIQA